MFTINDLDNLKKEIGTYGRAVLEDYVNAMTHVSKDLIRNDREMIVEYKEKDVYTVCESYCTANNIRLCDLIEALDREAERRAYVKKRFEMGAA